MQECPKRNLPRDVVRAHIRDKRNSNSALTEVIFEIAQEEDAYHDYQCSMDDPIIRNNDEEAPQPFLYNQFLQTGDDVYNYAKTHNYASQPLEYMILEGAPFEDEPQVFHS